MKHSPEGPYRRLVLQSGRLRSVNISRPVSTDRIAHDSRLTVTVRGTHPQSINEYIGDLPPVQSWRCGGAVFVEATPVLGIRLASEAVPNL
jgi:hypothetical protein